MSSFFKALGLKNPLKPKHTLTSVALDIANGLRDGSVRLEDRTQPSNHTKHTGKSFSTPTADKK